MQLICIKHSNSINLLDAKMTIDGRTYTFCGLAKEEYHDGLLWQWWIIMEDQA